MLFNIPGGKFFNEPCFIHVCFFVNLLNYFFIFVVQI